MVLSYGKTRRKGKNLPKLGADARMILEWLLKNGRDGDGYEQVILTWGKTPENNEEE